MQRARKRRSGVIHRPRWILLTAFWVILLVAGCSRQAPATVAPTAIIPIVTRSLPTATPGAASPEAAVAASTPIATAAPVTATLDPTATITPTPTATPTPSPTPLLDERGSLAAQALANGDVAAAEQHLTILATSVPSATVPGAGISAALALGRTYLDDGRLTEAEALFLSVAPDNADAYFFAGLAAARLNQCELAIERYAAYLDMNPDMAPYIQPLIADCHLILGDRAAAKAAYEAAQAVDAYFLHLYSIRLRLADLYLEDGEYDDAIEVYETIRRNAFTTNTRGEMTVRIGQTHALAGRSEAAFDAYRRAINEFPTVAFTHQALVALLDAGGAVDDMQRGIINFHAGVYGPAIEAFERHIQANPRTYQADAQLYLGWSHEGAGNIRQAVEALDVYASLSVSTAATGLFEKAELYRRQGMLQDAFATYDEVFATLPQEGVAADAGYWAAQTAIWLQENAAATESALAFAERFPADVRTADMLFDAGWLRYRLGDAAGAEGLWRRAAELHPSAEAGLAARLWLARLGFDAVAPADDTSYFGLRLNDYLNEQAPFSPESFSLSPAEDEQAVAAAWLRANGTVPDGAPVADLDPAIATDPILLRGTKLWRLGFQLEAKRELNRLRELYANDIVASYQLALYFRDIGLYQPSILAAENVIRLAQTNGFTTPAAIVKLAFPTHYADLVIPAATRYGFDPLLHFALIRQESLFESFAASSAAAQGLGQIIPATGEYIAGRLNDAAYREADLYRPIVNVPYSAYYLSEQLTLFDGAVHAALAAYNAGPGNALRWYDTAGDDIDLFVATINFAETELYVKNIYRWYAIYQHVYGATAAPASDVDATPAAANIDQSDG